MTGATESFDDFAFKYEITTGNRYVFQDLFEKLEADKKPIPSNPEIFDRLVFDRFDGLTNDFLEDVFNPDMDDPRDMNLATIMFAHFHKSIALEPPSRQAVTAEKTVILFHLAKQNRALAHHLSTCFAEEMQIEQPAKGYCIESLTESIRTYGYPLFDNEGAIKTGSYEKDTLKEIAQATSPCSLVGKISCSFLAHCAK